MTNPIKGQVAVVLGGLQLTLEFTIDAICALEGRLDEPATAIMARLTRDNTMTFLRALLWAALRENHPGYTEKMAGELIRLPGGDQLKTKVVQAFFAAWPDAEDAPADPPPRPTRKIRTADPAGAGRGSSRSGASTA